VKTTQKGLKKKAHRRFTAKSTYDTSQQFRDKQKGKASNNSTRKIYSIIRAVASQKQTKNGGVDRAFAFQGWKGGDNTEP